MKIVSVSALFPPEDLGGAEISAWNLANWLAGKGHEVHVLSTATSEEAAFSANPVGKLLLTRAYIPRSYPIYHFPQAPRWKKPLWHLQDHIDPRNYRIFDKFLEATSPDVAIVHYIQGIGYNALKALARRKIPTVFVLPDMGLVCVRMSMFKNGVTCATQCGMCKVSTRFKQDIIRQIPKVGFCSPSRSNLDRTDAYFHFGNRPHTSILNVNKYPFPDRPRRERPGLQILYVGRVHSAKGVDVLLAAARRLAAGDNLHVTVVGDGQDLAALQAEYGDLPWCSFTGKVTQLEVANQMNDADILCIPSIWLENSPGVAIHALQLGLPVLGSDVGGIPELVHHEKNGMLLPPGHVDAWAGAISLIMQEPDRLARWRDHARSNAGDFEQEAIGAKYLAFIESVRSADSER